MLHIQCGYQAASNLETGHRISVVPNQANICNAHMPDKVSHKMEKHSTEKANLRLTVGVHAVRHLWHWTNRGISSRHHLGVHIITTITNNSLMKKLAV